MLYASWLPCRKCYVVAPLGSDVSTIMFIPLVDSVEIAYRFSHEVIAYKVPCRRGTRSID